MRDGPKKKRRHRGEGSVSSYATAGGLRWRGQCPGGRPRKGGFTSSALAWAWVRQHHRKAAAPGTLGEWLDKWLELRKADFAPNTQRTDRWRVRRWLQPRLGKVKLRDLTGLHVRQMLADMAGEGISDAERQVAGRTLRKALNEAVALGIMSENPMSNPRTRVRLPTPRRPEKKVFEQGQIAALLRAADVQGKGHVIRLWLDAGLRPGEMFALDWEDIDLAAGKVRITKSLDDETHTIRVPKTLKSRRTIKLSAQTVEALKVAAGSGVFLKAVRSKDDRWWASWHRKVWWIPLLREAGLEGLGFTAYSLRHSAATHLLRSGVPLKVVADRLGHSNPMMTLTVYAHVLKGDDDRAAEVMGSLLNGGG